MRNNRILVAQGLARIRVGRSLRGHPGAHARGRTRTRRATTYDLGFVVGPRLNAAGRLEDMTVGIECLATDDPPPRTRLAA